MYYNDYESEEFTDTEEGSISKSEEKIEYTRQICTDLLRECMESPETLEELTYSIYRDEPKNFYVEQCHRIHSFLTKEVPCDIFHKRFLEGYHSIVNLPHMATSDFMPEYSAYKQRIMDKYIKDCAARTLDRIDKRFDPGIVIIYQPLDIPIMKSDSDFHWRKTSEGCFLSDLIETDDHLQSIFDIEKIKQDRISEAKVEEPREEKVEPQEEKEEKEEKVEEQPQEEKEEKVEEPPQEEKEEKVEEQPQEEKEEKVVSRVEKTVQKLLEKILASIASKKGTRVKDTAPIKIRVPPIIKQTAKIKGVKKDKNVNLTKCIKCEKPTMFKTVYGNRYKILPFCSVKCLEIHGKKDKDNLKVKKDKESEE